jgi:hypothetical protein
MRPIPSPEAALAVALFLAAASCAGVQSSSQKQQDGGGGINVMVGSGGTGGGGLMGAAGAPAADSGMPPPSCKNLQCKQVYCPDGMPTTLTGVVYAPDGKLPLYDVLVYVPNAPLPAVPPGLACDRCGAIPPGEPVVNALTDARGRFTLMDPPSGDNIPLVIQVGKWRRQVTVPTITPCMANQISDPQVTRLPRNRSEGNMPRIAMTTGLCDDLVCLLPKLGIDPAELGIAGDNKAVTLFAGANDLITYDPHLGMMTSAKNLWGNLNELMNYDMIIGSCECDPDSTASNKGPAAYSAVTQYLGMGGRLFITDQQYIWFQQSPDPNLSGWATFQTDPLSTGTSPITLDTTFPKGKALADWLVVVNPGNTYAQILADQVFDNFTSAKDPPAQVWASSPLATDPMTTHPRIMTVNTPAGASEDQQCGRVVHIDSHVRQLDTWEGTYPTGCGPTLETGEQVLAFFLFDAAACIQPDSKPVMPPPIVP